jgi:hypothetical protein
MISSSGGFSMKYRPLYAAGAVLLAGSWAVYAQAQDKRLDPPEGKANQQQQAPSGATQKQEQPQGNKAEQPKEGERTQGGQADQRENAGKQTGKADQRENTENQAGQQKERGGGQSADGDNLKERNKAEKSNASDPTNQGAAADKNKQSAEKAGGGKAKQREASGKLQPQQKTVIKETIVKRNVRPAQINFSINIGTVVPRTVVLYDLPPIIIEVAPDYRGYKYILADDDTILVIDPETWEIVDVIDV